MGSKWHNKWKFSKRVYSGSYGKEAESNERVFILSCKLKNGKHHNLAFESHQAAKRDGWVKK